MTGHDSVVQCSVIVPYNMLIWLKKSTAEKERETATVHILCGEKEELTVHSYPLVEIFSFGELDCQLQVPTAKSGCCMLHHVMLVTALRNSLEVLHSLSALVASASGERERERQ